jgi:transmembrane sensor
VTKYQIHSLSFKHCFVLIIMDEDLKQIQSYILLYLEGKLSSADQLQLNRWMDAHPDNRQLFEELTNGEMLREQLQRLHEVDTEAALKRFNLSEYAPQKSIVKPIVHRIHFLRRWGWAAAAVLILGVGITTAIVVSSDRKPGKPTPALAQTPASDILPGTNRAVLTVDNKEINLSSNKTGIAVGETISYTDGEKLSDAGKMLTLTTPKGGQYQVTLPDGTRAWLNASSSITFPITFAAGERHVTITGEIYFEVTKNKQKPFVVDVDGKSRVQVLGTSFNINSYGDDGNIKTTLLEGSVKVIRGDTTAVAVSSDRQAKSSETAGNYSQSVILKPGQQAVLKNTTGIFVVNSPDIEQTLAWKNGIFDFTGADLQSVMKQLERWYDIKVQYSGAVPKITFDGKMYRNVNFSGVLEMLNTMDVKFRMEGKTLIVL